MSYYTVYSSRMQKVLSYRQALYKSLSIYIYILRKQDKLTQNCKHNHKTHTHKKINMFQSPCRWSLTSCSKPSGGQRKDLAAWSLERVACFLDVTGNMDDLNGDVPPCFLVSSGRTQGTQTIKISISNRTLFYAHCMELDRNYHGVQTTETGNCVSKFAWFLKGQSLTFPTATHRSPSEAELLESFGHWRTALSEELKVLRVQHWSMLKLKERLMVLRYR